MILTNLGYQANLVNPFDVSDTTKLKHHTLPLEMLKTKCIKNLKFRQKIKHLRKTKTFDIRFKSDWYFINHTPNNS